MGGGGGSSLPLSLILPMPVIHVVLVVKLVPLLLCPTVLTNDLLIIGSQFHPHSLHEGVVIHCFSLQLLAHAQL